MRPPWLSPPWLRCKCSAFWAKLVCWLLGGCGGVVAPPLVECGGMRARWGKTLPVEEVEEGLAEAVGVVEAWLWLKRAEAMWWWWLSWWSWWNGNNSI